MLDLPIMGVNAPKEHQRVIRKLAMKLGNLFEDGSIPYEPFPETMIDEGKTSQAPDLILFDNENYQNKVIIEITTPLALKNDFEKVAVIAEKYEVAEGFAYDYIKKQWRKYKYGAGEITENPSYCESIGYDLNTFLS